MKKLLLIALLGATVGSAWGAATSDNKLKITNSGDLNIVVALQSIQDGKPKQWMWPIPANQTVELFNRGQIEHINVIQNP